MAKVHPHHVNPTSSSCKQKVFTLWMKSLVLGTNGCTVFDSNGEIVYRVDNYDHKCTSPVYIMDAAGDILITITKKKLSLLGAWEGYKSTNQNRPTTRFHVSKKLGIKGLIGYLKGRYSSSCKVKIGHDEYFMESEIGKSCCKIFDKFGGLVAQVKRKIEERGVVLGEDVLAMVVDPNIDHTLIVGLVVVLGLMHHIL